MKAKPQKANQTEPMTTLGVAQERGKRFYAELKTADDAMAAQLLAAWKELIMDELVNLLRVTKDPLVLQVLDEHRDWARIRIWIEGQDLERAKMLKRNLKN